MAHNGLRANLISTFNPNDDLAYVNAQFQHMSMTGGHMATHGRGPNPLAPDPQKMMQRQHREDRERREQVMAERRLREQKAKKVADWAGRVPPGAGESVAGVSEEEAEYGVNRVRHRSGGGGSDPRYTDQYERPRDDDEESLLSSSSRKTKSSSGRGGYYPQGDLATRVRRDSFGTVVQTDDEVRPKPARPRHDHHHRAPPPPPSSSGYDSSSYAGSVISARESVVSSTDSYRGGDEDSLVGKPIHSGPRPRHGPTKFHRKDDPTRYLELHEDSMSSSGMSSLGSGASSISSASSSRWYPNDRDYDSDETVKPKKSSRRPAPPPPAPRDHRSHGSGGRDRDRDRRGAPRPPSSSASSTTYVPSDASSMMSGSTGMSSVSRSSRTTSERSRRHHDDDYYRDDRDRRHRYDPRDSDSDYRR